MKSNKQKSKNIKLEQEQFIEINNEKKNQYKTIFNNSKSTSTTTTQPTPISDIILNFLSTTNNSQQLIQIKKLESICKSLQLITGEYNGQEKETIISLIDFIFFIQFSIGSKNVSINKSMSSVIVSLVNVSGQFKELVIKKSNESIETLLSTDVTMMEKSIFSIAFVVDVSNCPILSEESTVFKFINIISNQLYQQSIEFQKSTSSNTIVLYDCEHTLRSLVTLFSRFSNLISNQISTITSETIINNSSSSNNSTFEVVSKSMQSLLTQLEMILSNPTLPRQLGTNAGYLISQIITLYGTDSSSIQKQVLSSLVESEPNTSILDLLHSTTSPASFQSKFKTLPEINQVSILRGLSLTGNIKLSLTNSLYNNKNENIFLNIIFKGIYNYCSGTVDQHNRFISLECFHLCILKIKEWVIAAESNGVKVDEIITTVFPSCESYEQFFNQFFHMALDIVWRNWESSIQNISGLSNEIFDELLTIHYKCCSDPMNLNSTANALKSSSFINSITIKLIDEDWYQKNKYILLKYVLERVGPVYMIQLRGNFLKNIFSSMCDHTICNSVKVFLELFIQELKKQFISNDNLLLDGTISTTSTTTLTNASENSLNRIEKYWIYPLLEILTKTDSVTCSRIIVYALPTCLKLFPESLFKILNILINQNESQQQEQQEEQLDDELKIFKNLNYNVRIRISLALLNASRQLSLIDGRELQSKYHGIIEKSLENQDESLRLLGLELLCVGPKLTERITIRELELVKNFTLLNLKGSSPYIRNQTLSTLYRFWIRLRESCCKVFRASTNNNINIEKDDPALQGTDDRYLSIDDLVEYINWSCQLFAYNLYPDAPFSRKMLPLEAFSEFVDIWSSKGEGSEKKSLLEFLEYIEKRSVLLYSKDSTDILINNLWDSYDRCREVSTDILMKFPSPLPGMESDEKIISFILWAIKLACSPKARECDTGAFALKLYLKKYVSSGLVPIFHSSTSTPVTFAKFTDRNRATLEFVTQVLRILKSQTKLASTNLLEAAKFAPMHGLILSLRYILSEVQFQDIGKNTGNPDEKKQWRELIGEIIELMKTISSIVLRVVADLAPEGNNPNQLLKSTSTATTKDGLPSSLPSGVIYDDDERLATNFSSSICMDDEIEMEDEDEDEEQGDEEGEEDEISGGVSKSDQNLKGGVGQIITVCSWQCTKQISLVLGTILDKLEMPSSDEDDQVCMITTKQIEEIGHQFFTILLQSRHKGAIEKTYLGFQVLCATLMKSTNSKLSSLPSNWIKFLFERVKEQSLQITRRSAGLPFAFIGILTGESTTNQRVNHLLNLVMDNLLLLAGGGQDETNNSNQQEENNVEKNIYLPQVHSINILKSIFRARAIIQELDQYLAVTLITVIKAFSSKSWSVRNSATMAFSVLVDRIIGTKKLKSDNTIINTTTFYHFFSRMPIVYPFLLDYFRDSLASILSTSSKVVEQEEEQNKIIQSTVYAILVLFSRLQPSNIDHPNDPLAPAQFVPLISQCCQFSNYMVRQISARALVPLVSTIELVPFIRELLKKLLEETSTTISNHNKVHGMLLQIYHLIKGHLPTINQKEREITISTILTEFIPKLSWIQNSNIPPIQFIYFSILSELEKNSANGLQSINETIVNGIVENCKIQLLIGQSSDNTGKFNSTLTNLPMFYTWIESVLQFYLLNIKKQVSSNASTMSNEIKQQLSIDIMKLFNHSLYEIKIFTIRFLLKNRQIVNEILVDQQQLQATIINMILNDPNSSCRKKAFKLLSFISLPLSVESIENKGSNVGTVSKSSPTNLYQLLCNTMWGISNSMKKESIVLFGHYLKQFYQQRIVGTTDIESVDGGKEEIEKVLNNWIKMVKEISKSNQPLELRQAITKSIEACCDVIFVEHSNSKLLSLVSIESWLAIAVLLEDDDETIRSQSSTLSSKLLYKLSSNCTTSSIDNITESDFVIKQGSKCLEQVLNYLSSKSSMNGDLIFEKYIELLKLDNITIFDSDFQNSKVLFDKEKDNYFEEQLVKIQLITFEIEKINKSSSSSSLQFLELRSKVMNQLLKCTLWLKNTRELNVSSNILSHWLTYNPEIFTLFYTYLIICNSVISGENSNNTDYATFISTIKSNLKDTTLHPVLTMTINNLFSKIDSTSNSTTTPKNYYFLTSKQ